MKLLTQNIARFLFPPYCLVCMKETILDNGICHICWGEIEFIHNNCCKICGYPYTGIHKSSWQCGNCINDKPLFSQARSIFVYNEHSSILIKKLKYYDKPELAQYLAKLMYNHDLTFFNDVDLITSVPLHWYRQFKRLYNQASLLGIYLSQYTDINFVPQMIQRIRYTKPQYNLSLSTRRANLRKAFAANKKYNALAKNKNILLIDDVFTSGETLRLCTKELLKLECNSVKILTLGRSKL